MTSQLFDDIQAINDIHAALGKSPVTEATFQRRASESDEAFARRVRNYQIKQYATLQHRVANKTVDFLN